MKCSVCTNAINEKYCPTCGQHFKSGKITSLSLLKDLFGNLFSLEKSFIENVKLAFQDPQKLITNYWNGFRGYYYSPGKFLVIASIFFLVQLTFFDDFLGGYVYSNTPPQFTFLTVIILLNAFLSWIVYWNFKRTFYEHLVLNIYNVSIWSMVFVPISMLLNLLDVTFAVERIFVVLLLLVIVVWNSRVFEITNSKRVLYILVNVAMVVLTIGLMTQFVQEGAPPK